jgi:predicted GIY-YIG superfamily endonuclease
MSYVPNYSLGKVYTNAEDTTKYCKQTIIDLKKINHGTYYIGAGHDPQERLNFHIEDKNMTKMFVITSCPTKSKTISLEKKLIKRFNSDAPSNKCINQGGGGEGIIEPPYDGSNYIYIIFE